MCVLRARFVNELRPSVLAIYSVYSISILCLEILTCTPFEREEELRGLGGLMPRPVEAEPALVVHGTMPPLWACPAMLWRPRAGGVTSHARWRGARSGGRRKRGVAKELGPHGRRRRRLSDLLSGQRRSVPRRSGSWAATLF